MKNIANVKMPFRGRTQAEVVAALRKAAELAEAGGAL